MTENREVLRMKFYTDVYLAAVKNEEGYNAADTAQKALDHFDKQFPDNSWILGKPKKDGDYLCFMSSTVKDFCNHQMVLSFDSGRWVYDDPWKVIAYRTLPPEPNC